MQKILFFFIILLFSFKSQQKLASDRLIDHPSVISTHPTPFSSSIGQDKNTDDAYLQKRGLGSTQNHFHKFQPSERSIVDYISQTQFDLLDQMKELNHGSSLHSDSFRSSIYLEQKDQSLMRRNDQPLFEEEFEHFGKGIMRFLQSETDWMNILEENIEIGNMEEEVSSGESEHGEDENGSSSEGENGGNESESGERGPGNGETGEGETNEDTEDSWLEGEICFEDLSPIEEIIIVEDQQSESAPCDSEPFRLLAPDIEINVNVDIHIDIEKVQEQNSEEAEVSAFSVTSINPGENNCYTERICRYVNIPRLGKRCICRQQVICLY